MDVLVWWIFPAVATLAAIGWAAWARRPPRRRGDADTVEAYARFRAALARPAETSARVNRQDGVAADSDGGDQRTSGTHRRQS